jgi:tetratricopeptide (TPR) repeat protein
VTGEVEKAQSVLSAALEKSPEFAGARATLGTLHLMQGQLEQAEVELGNAERLAPDLSLVQWARADLMLRQGRREDALAVARKAYETRPSFDAGLRYAALLRQAAKYEEMRKLAGQLVERTPSYRRDDIRGVLSALLGPTALEGEPGPAGADAEDVSDLAGSDLKLDLPAPGLSGPAGSAGSAAKQDGTRLRLGQPDRKLHLDMGTK